MHWERSPVYLTSGLIPRSLPARVGSLEVRTCGGIAWREKQKAIPLTRRTSQPIAWAGLGVGLSFGTVLCISDLINSVAVLDSSSEMENFLPARASGRYHPSKKFILVDSIFDILCSRRRGRYSKHRRKILRNRIVDPGLV